MIKTANEGLRLGAAFINRMRFAGDAATAAQATAIMDLCKALNDNIGMSKFHAIYPFIGGSAAAHALDLMGAYDLTFNGGWTHNASGVQPNGTTGYADTGLNPSTVMSATDAHLSCYEESGTTGSFRCLLGNGSAAAGSGLLAMGALDAGAKVAGTIAGINDPAPDDYAPTDAQGDTSRDHFHAIDVTTSQSQQFYRAGVAHQDAVTARGTLQSDTIYVGARNNAGASGYDNAIQKFTSIGLHLTAAEHLALYNAVQAYQVALTRQH